MRKGDDLHARSDVSLAATLAGVNESLAGCISLHALEHALSAKNPNLTHGQGLAMLLSPTSATLSTRAPHTSASSILPVRSASRERRHPPISLRCYTTFSLPAVLRTSHGGRRAFRRKTSRTSSTMPEAPWAHSSGATRRNSRTKISSKSSSAPGGTERSAVPPKMTQPRPFRTGVVLFRGLRYPHQKAGTTAPLYCSSRNFFNSGDESAALSFWNSARFSSPVRTATTLA